MKENYYILMADIIDSRDKNQMALMTDFQKLVKGINKVKHKLFLSPMTITLGDEFQAIPKNLASAIEIIFALEESIVANDQDYKLRYVLYYGSIETKINKQIAHGMLGEGLTNARKKLEIYKHKQKGKRFVVTLSDKHQAGALNNAFVLYQSIVDGWNLQRDFEIVSNFLKFGDYKIVAEKMMKEPSLMWKREKSIQLAEYIAAKNLIEYIVKR